MHHEKRTATLRLFSPLFSHIQRKNEWGDIEDYREDLIAGEVLEYEDEILALIQKERLPSEGDRGHVVLRKALQNAVKKDILDSNPADRVDRPKKNVYQAQVYSAEEMIALFDAVSDDPLGSA